MTRRADVAPRAPIDGLGWYAHGPQDMCEGIDEHICRRMVCLTGVADDRGRRGEEHDEIRLSGSEQARQIPGALDLGRKDLGEAWPILMQYQPVIEHACGMNHSRNDRP